MANYNYGNVSKVLAFVVMNCPICKEPFRTKAMLRNHLHSNHKRIELESFLIDNEK